MSIYSLEVEKFVLGGLLKYPETFADINQFVCEEDFFSNVHKTIFCVIKQLALKRVEIDKVLVAQTIKNMNITFEDDINVFDYVEALSLIQINKNAVIDACKELKKYTIARDLQETCSKISKTIKSSLDKNPQEIITLADKIYNERISMYQFGENPINIFDIAEQIIEERGNNPVEEIGLKTPYPEFNNLFGGLKNGNLYSFVSRGGGGKSTLLADICYKMCNIQNKNIRMLYLDTEMEKNDLIFRMIASISKTPMWFLETGNWRKNDEMTKKVREAWKFIKGFKFDHLHVSGKSIEEICSICRRWYYSQVGRGNKALIAYDYIKLTGERISNDWKEYQAIGEKVDILKKLSVELQCPVLTACQMNRSAEGKDAVDDSSAIAQSDRLHWFSTFVGIFRRKTVEEIGRDGEQFGTHKLIPLKARFQGKNATGHHDLVKIDLPENKFKYVNNYINFNVDNFDVEERGTLRSIVERSTKNFDIVPKTESEDGKLL